MGRGICLPPWKTRICILLSNAGFTKRGNVRISRDWQIRETSKKFCLMKDKGTLYNDTLYKGQRTQFITNHQFVVINTTHWHWSIEKHSDKILFQRDKYRFMVRKFRGNPQKRSSGLNRTWWLQRNYERFYRLSLTQWWAEESIPLDGR